MFGVGHMRVMKFGLQIEPFGTAKTVAVVVAGTGRCVLHLNAGGCTGTCE